MISSTSVRRRCSSLSSSLSCWIDFSAASMLLASRSTGVVTSGGSTGAAGGGGDAGAAGGGDAGGVACCAGAAIGSAVRKATASAIRTQRTMSKELQLPCGQQRRQCPRASAAMWLWDPRRVHRAGGAKMPGRLALLGRRLRADLGRNKRPGPRPLVSISGGNLAMHVSVRSLVAAAAVFACVGAPLAASAQDKKPIALRYTTGAPAKTPWVMQLERFAKDVEEESQGAIKIEQFIAAQLGNEQDTIQQVARGRIDMGGFSTGAVALVLPELAVLSI